MRRLLTVLLTLVLAFSAMAQEKVMTLDECVGMALEKNPGLIRSEFQMKMAGKDVWISLANLLPSASGFVGYSHRVDGPLSGTYIDPTTGIEVPIRDEARDDYNSNAYVQISQSISVSSIFNFKASLSNRKASVFGHESNKQNTIYLVKERYYNLLKAEKLLEVAEETALSSQESLKRAKALYEVGKAPKSDVLTAQVEAERAKLEVIRAENGLSIARASLNHVLGKSVDNPIKIQDNLDVPEVAIDYSDALSNAVAKHPMLKQAEANLSASKDGVMAAVGAWLPNLSLSYSNYWLNKDFDEISNFMDTDYNRTYSARLNVPIFQGGARVAGTAKAQLLKKANQEALTQAKRDIELEVKQAYFEVQQYHRQIAVARNAEEAANEGLRLNQERYTLGAGTMLDLLNAQVQSRQAKSDFIQALYSYKYAIARLERAMGQLKQ